MVINSNMGLGKPGGKSEDIAGNKLLRAHGRDPLNCNGE